eukprot:gene10311-11378_t
MAEKWKAFKKKMEEKRDINKRNKEKPTKKSAAALKSGELTVQGLSTFVFGKAQKYSQVGHREFVPHQKEDITFESIKQSCKTHFAPKMDPDQVIDILASEQGPSSQSLTQIRDLKLIHIRFVSKTLIESDDEDETFDLPVLEGMSWSSIPEQVKFNIETESFAEGGFRKAFKANGAMVGYKGTWVMKEYLPKTLEVIKNLGQSTESHTKRVIQMNSLAKNFADELAKRVDDVCKVEFGRVPFYHEFFFGKLNGNCVSMVPFIGVFCKHIKNTGNIREDANEITKKAECLAHLSYIKSAKELMLLDLQGNGYLNVYKWYLNKVEGNYTHMDQFNAI